MDAERETSARAWSALEGLLDVHVTLKVVHYGEPHHVALDTVIERTADGIRQRTYEQGRGLSFEDTWTERDAQARILMYLEYLLELARLQYTILRVEGEDDRRPL